MSAGLSVKAVGAFGPCPTHLHVENGGKGMDGGADCGSQDWSRRLACIAHQLTAEARDSSVITSLRLPAVLTVLFKYASARQAARASY